MDENKASSSLGVPGGVYCIKKSTIARINYFNSLPFGGGDNLFWCEFFDYPHKNCCIELCKRHWIFDAICNLAEETKLKRLWCVSVNVYHFYHGT